MKFLDDVLTALEHGRLDAAVTAWHRSAPVATTEIIDAFELALATSIGDALRLFPDVVAELAMLPAAQRLRMRSTV